MPEELDEVEDGAISKADRDRGTRAEEVAQWYLRLNGFFLIPGFVVHPDLPHRTPRTEADFLGIRLKYSSEGVWKIDRLNRSKTHTAMKDDLKLIQAGLSGTVTKNLGIMVEVKAGKCKVNGPWSDRRSSDQKNGQSNMERALARVGFFNRELVTAASDAMYEELRYDGKEFIVQYITIGKYKDEDLQQKYPLLIQITFDEIANFLKERFTKFPQKIPLDSDIQLWPGFGHAFCQWFERSRHQASLSDCQAAVIGYINTNQI